MNSRFRTTLIDIMEFRSGKISLDELMTRNDDNVVYLSNPTVAADPGSPTAWALVADLEGLIADRIYRRISDVEFRQSITALVPAWVLETGMEYLVAGQLLVGMHRLNVLHVLPPFAASRSGFVLDGERHARQQVSVQPEIEPSDPLRISSKAHRVHHGVTESWSVKPQWFGHDH